MSAFDSREAILNRLVAILDAVPELTGRAYRDRGDLSGSKLPACVVLDGSEALVVRQSDQRGPPSQVYQLKPQVFVVLRPRDDKTNTTLDGQAAPVGSELSAYRVKVLRAILSDSLLYGLLGSNGSVIYEGCETDMQTGSLMEGSIRFDFTLAYTLNPNDL
jgi:hypothetical protein